MIAGPNTNAQMFHPLYSTDQLSAVSTSLYPAALQSIRPNEVPVGGGGRYHWYTPNPTQPNPTTVGAHHTAAGIWDQTIDTKNYFGALQWSDLYCPVMRMCKTHHVAMIMIYFMEAATVVVWFSQCVEKTNIWNVRMDASKGVSVKVTGLLLFPALDNLPLMLCYDTVQMCLFDMSNFHLTFTSSKMLNI